MNQIVAVIALLLFVLAAALNDGRIGWVGLAIAMLGFLL
jgi:hypothetical protein